MVPETAMSTWLPSQHTKPRLEQCGRWTITGLEPTASWHLVLSRNRREVLVSMEVPLPLQSSLPSSECTCGAEMLLWPSISLLVKAEAVPAERSCGCQYSVIVAVTHVFVAVHISKVLTHLTLPLNMTGVLLIKHPSLLDSAQVFWFLGVRCEVYTLH